MNLKNSMYITEKLSEQIYSQNLTAGPDLEYIRVRKNVVEKSKENFFGEKLSKLKESPLSSQYLKRLLDLACEKGSRAWLTALPIQIIGYKDMVLRC